jgi:hypothetical protein
MVMGMVEVEKLIEIYRHLEDAGLMVVAGKKDTAELMVSHDVVPVVRCKDCKHWQQNCALKDFGVCCRVDYDPPVTRADDFCSYGERRTVYD